MTDLIVLGCDREARAEAVRILTAKLLNGHRHFLITFAFPLRGLA